MPNNSDPLCVCLDANVIISAIAFGGKPLEILERTLCREFLSVTGLNIIDEVERNLVGKLGLKKEQVSLTLNDLLEVSSVFIPPGHLQLVDSVGDNLVLEVADAGGCDILVTGDRKHLLPLGTFKTVIIEPPSAFLLRLNSRKNR